MFFKRITISLSVIGLLCLSNIVIAQTMTSGTYKIQSDSINFSGNRSASGAYSVEDTVGETATGESSSTLFKIKAGYQQMQEIILSITAAADVVMSPAIGGITGGTSNGSTSFIVTTDNPAGYTVTIKASSSPALQSPLDTIADYAAPASNPDFNFSILSSESAFAFSPEGVDIANSFKDNGSICNIGSSDTSEKCWAGLSTSQQTIVNRTSGNHTSGTLTTLKFRVESGSSHVQTAGTYVATTTITLLPL